jgi:hypothetical protein
MTATRTVDQVMSVEMAKGTEMSNPFATAWLCVLGLILGSTLLCSAVLMAWPIVAQYAANLH